MKQQSSIKEATKNVWGASPAGTTHAKDLKPGTKAFFEKVLKERFGKEHDFLPEFVRYQDWKGRRVLEIGCGAGYDAYMFCKNGADYTGIDIVSENIERTKKHLDLYGLKANIFEMDAEKLIFDEKFDLIYSFGVLHHIPKIDVVMQKIKDNLADDGVLKLAVYNKNSIFYWLHLWWWDHIMCGGFLKQSFKKRLAAIEFTESDSDPYVTVYTKGTIKRLLKQSKFRILSISIEKLDISDLPPIKLIGRLYNYIPQSFLNLLARRWGWYLCLEARVGK